MIENNTNATSECSLVVASYNEGVLCGVEIMPVSMVFGSYITGYPRYAYFDGTFIDIRYLFPFVALVVIIVCLPLIYKRYTNHQVSN